jgi:hypothetical protein
MADRLTIDVVWPDERKVYVEVLEREDVPPGDGGEAYQSKTLVDTEPIESEDLDSKSLRARLSDLTIAEGDGAVVNAWCWEGDNWKKLLGLLELSGDDRHAVIRLDDGGG